MTVYELGKYILNKDWNVGRHWINLYRYHMGWDLTEHAECCPLVKWLATREQ